MIGRSEGSARRSSSFVVTATRSGSDSGCPRWWGQIFFPRSVPLGALLPHHHRGTRPLYEGHYFLRIKDNQPRLLRTLTSFFASSTRRAQAATITAHHTVKGHGRLETYRLRATTALNSYLMHEYGWPSVGHVLCIEHTREMLASGQVIHMVH
jgi:hypothetical protein